MQRFVAQRLADEAMPARRTLDDRLAVRFPRVYVRLLAAGSRVSPQSRLRQRLLRRAARSGLAAVGRADYDLMLVRYDPGIVYAFSPEFVTLGLPEQARGHDEVLRGFTELDSAWEQWIATPHVIVDGGARILILGHLRFRGASSGVEVGIALAQVLDVRGGLVVRERDFNQWAEALDAAGLDPAALARIEALRPGETAEL